MVLPGRDTFDPQYRFGFNGKENELDFRGVGQITDYGARIYNTRLGKFLSLDPLTKSYPWYTPYQFAGNTPIWAIDLDGKEPLIATNFKSLDALKTRINISYATEGDGDNKVHKVTISQTFKGIYLSHTLANNGGPTNEELKSTWGKTSYTFQHPENAYVLNKINNMSYRKENDQKMAFGDMEKNIRGNLAVGQDKGTLNNTMLHVTGQALITTLFGKEIGDISGDIHERDQTALMTGIIPAKEEKQAIDNYVDIINNKWGQRWGEAISNDLGITKDSKWTPELMANYLNALQEKFTKSMGLKFDKKFDKKDDFIKKYAEFINKNK